MEYLKTKRVISVPVFRYDKNVYFRVRDIANLLEVKQVYQFTSDIKKVLGYHAILKYENTKNFRTKHDLPSAPFVKAEDLLLFLENPKHLKHRINLKRKSKIKKEITDLLLEKDG